MYSQLLRCSRVLPRCTRNFHSTHRFRTNSSFQRFRTFRQFRTFCTAPLHPEPEVDKEALKENARKAQQEARKKKIENKRRTQLRDDEEIDLLSPTGFIVMGVAALLFYGIYRIDQEKHKGFDSSITSAFSDFIGGTKTLEYYLKRYEKYGKPELLPDEWKFWKILFEHLKNKITFKGNWESLYSKCIRLASMPGKTLLPPMRDTDSIRTLVVDLDTIIHSTWSRKTEFERHPRPHWKEFLRDMVMSGWEVVVFGKDEQMDWEDPEHPENMAILDDKGYLQGNVLWGKDMYYFNSHKCKDITRLNRNPSRIVVLDSNARNVQLCAENVVLLTPWTGQNENDTELEDIALFLKFIQSSDVEDVRSLISNYRGVHVPTAFKEEFMALLGNS